MSRNYMIITSKHKIMKRKGCGPQALGSPFKQTGTFAPTENKPKSAVERVKQMESEKRNKNKKSEKEEPCPEGKTRVYGFAGSSCQ